MHRQRATGLGIACLTVAITAMSSAANAADYQYVGGRVTTCTTTCDSFASLTALPEASALNGTLSIDVGASDTFTAADITNFSFLVTSPDAPLEAYDGTNPTTANPLPVNSSIAVIEASNTAGTSVTGGTTNANGEIDSGLILFRFTVPPFNSNDAWVIFDVGTGKAQVCLFFDSSGCIPSATESVIFENQGFTLASSGVYDYKGGDSVICASTCDSFASLTGPPTPSRLTGSLSINVGAGAAFTAADITAFNFLVTSPTAPMEPYDGGNPTTANPLPVGASVAVLEASNSAGTVTTGGTTDANGQITSGTVLFRFIVPPFSNNDAWVIFDVGAGTAQVCLFFDTSGCIPGATESVVIAVSPFSLIPDTDGDGVNDAVDNCTLVSNATQLDTDGDGYGNICDPDLNNDLVVNFLDLGLMKSVFFGTDDDADLDGNGAVNFLDLGIMKAGFFGAPGPSGTTP